MEFQSSTYASPSRVLSDESARTFMAGVYRWMFAGLAITGATAWFVASSQAAINVVFPLRMPLMIVSLVMVFAFAALAPRVSAVVAGLLFVAYAFVTGLTMSAIFLVYNLGSIGETFLVTAGAFGALSLYGTVTKRDLTAWRSFLIIGLVGVVLAGLVNLFLHSAPLSFVLSCAGVLVFGGLTAYDTQKLRAFHAQSGYASAGALAINGALILYLDFINLFLSLLRLMGRRR